MSDYKEAQETKFFLGITTVQIRLGTYALEFNSWNVSWYRCNNSSHAYEDKITEIHRMKYDSNHCVIAITDLQKPQFTAEQEESSAKAKSIKRHCREF